MGSQLLRGPTEHPGRGPSRTSHLCGLGRSLPLAATGPSGPCCHLPARLGCPPPPGPWKVAPRVCYGLSAVPALGKDPDAETRPSSGVSAQQGLCADGVLIRTRDPGAPFCTRAGRGEDVGEEHGSLGLSGGRPELGGPQTHLTGLLLPPALALPPSPAPPALSSLGTEQQPKESAG